MSTATCDILVIGGGMAGASAGYELAAAHRVILLEQEDQPGYHSTGRSAAMFSAIYGGPPVRALSRASRAFFDSPPPGFGEQPLLAPRGMLFFGADRQLDQLRELEATEQQSGALRWLDRRAVLELVPAFRPEAIAGALLEAGAADIEVHALHQGYLRGLRARGGEVRLAQPLIALARNRDEWVAQTAGGAVRAPIVVNAAGAWGDTVAMLGGVRPLGLSARRRTAVLVDGPADRSFECWPLSISIDETLYFRPDAGKLLVSPADEVETEAGDAQPEEYDVAVAIDRLETVTTLNVRRVPHRWAGLRTFAPDRVPVAGFDADAEGFFWLVGQGGYGIQTAPALAKLVRGLIAEAPVVEELAAQGVEAEAFSPARFRS